MWWLGDIYSPNHQSVHWGGCLSTGAPDSPVRHRTLSSAPATSPSCWVPTVGASDNGATRQSGGAPDRSCSLFGAPSAPALTSARAVAHCSVADDRWREVAFAPLAHRTVRCYTGQSGELYWSGLQNSRRSAVRSWSPWCTGHCPVAYRTVRCARPGHTSVIPCSFC